MGDGSVSSSPDATSGESLDPASIARTLLEGLRTRRREIVIATAILTAVELRCVDDPKGLFTQSARARTVHENGSRDHRRGALPGFRSNLVGATPVADVAIAMMCIAKKTMLDC